jgi:Uma2 family endonuclease
MTEQQVKYYSISEYLTLEEQSEERHEYEAGQIRAMSGGTINHAILGNNINTALNINLKDAGCIALTGDARIWIDSATSFVYPDATIVCGEIETAEQDEHSIINPTLIVEVLSKSTESYDRGDKFHKYCALPSFKEYVLIDQNKPVIDLLYREEPGYWRMMTVIGLDKSITLSSIGCSIKMEDIYRNVRELEEPAF